MVALLAVVTDVRSASVAQARADQRITSYVYGSPAASTTTQADTIGAGFRGYDSPRDLSRPHTRISGGSVAAKDAEEAGALAKALQGGGKAPELSKPYGTHTILDHAGNVKQVTTYDRFGRRAHQYDVGPGTRHGEGSQVRVRAWLGTRRAW